MSSKMHTTSDNSEAALRDLLGQYPIRRSIFSNLDTGSILNLCRSSWGVRTDIYTYLWDINRKLERFFQNPRAFRTELGRANALISGSFALQFFANKYWPESDLDIYLREDENVARLGKYLVEAEGYQLASNQEIAAGEYARIVGYGGRLAVISTIVTYTKPPVDEDDPSSIPTAENPKPPTNCKIQLVATRHQPVQAILSGFYTSCIMNFISWNKAYCVFPRATLLFGETVTLASQRDEYVELHKKYSRRGWRLRTVPIFLGDFQLAVAAYRDTHRSKAGNDYFGRSHPLGAEDPRDRRVGGKDTWTMKLGIAGVEPPPQPDSVLEYSSFGISGFRSPEHQENGSEILICASPFNSHSLRYQYTYTGMADSWRRLNDLLNQNTRGQAKTKLSEKEASSILNVPNGVKLCDIGFDKPVGWDFWDDVSNPQSRFLPVLAACDVNNLL
ncbi:hypothetical protein F4803DRAFT_557410 [Xylaria telfairii]|nr:hypothetical protein F4803DRAFT_557410 [Xylaria telfairii]